MFSWSVYNEKLVKRGELLFNLNFVNNMEEELKEMNKGKKGRPYKFPNSVFRFLAKLYPFFNNYRLLEGLCRKLNEVIPKFPTPDHTTIERRIEGKFEEPEIKGNVLIVDSSGFQMGRSTEYIEYKHKLRRRKKWVKVHVITDGERLVDVEITPNNVGDSPVFRKMFERVRKKAGNEKLTVIGDAAYDARENFNMVAESGHRPLFKVRSDSSTLARSAPVRRRAVLEQRNENWSKESGYTKRWCVEAVFSAMKRMFGEKLSSRKPEYVVRELLIMVSLFNMFHSL